LQLWLEAGKSMKRSKFNEAQIAFILQQAETGTPIGDVCRPSAAQTGCLMACPCDILHIATVIYVYAFGRQFDHAIGQGGGF
jgi:hypothetical protein